MTKRILITGKNSYIGNSFIKYCLDNEIHYQIDQLNVHGEKWKEFDFTPYNSVFHVAGIAHNSSDPKLKDLYYQVNRDLTVAIATKAKESGVGQFVFMSSMIVYGTHPSGKTKISTETVPNPDNFYGDSKLQAELELIKLESNDFKLAILRPPMIYGKGSKGNYPLLVKLAKKSPFFPDYPNKRSMLYVENLCKLVALIIKDNDRGTYHPQNSQYVQTSEMVKRIAESHKHKIATVKLFNFMIKRLFRIGIIRKVFGDLYYDQQMSLYDKKDYQQFDLNQSIKLTETKI